MFLSKNVIMDTFHCQKWLLLLIFAVYRRLDPVDGLKCFCNGDNLGCPNSTCVTDGYCFASASVVGNGEKKYSYHCIERKSLIPPEHPFSCSATRQRNDSLVIECCKSHDMCNRELRLELQPPKPPGTQYVRNVPSCQGELSG